MTEIMMIGVSLLIACGEEFHVCGEVEDYEGLPVGKRPCG